MKIHKGGLDDWSPADWMVALMGELGEAANLVKKLNRLRDGMDSAMGRKSKRKYTEAQLVAMIEEEVADAQCYLDLFSAKLGIDLGDVTRYKFNVVSEELEVEERI